MQWRRTDPVQGVGAMLAIGQPAVDRLTDAMSRKSPLVQSLPIERGPGWAVVFSAPVGPDNDVVLPRIEGAIPLHEAAEGWWLPVGVELDAPEHARAALWFAMSELGARPPAIVVPRLAAADQRAGEADVFLIGRPTPFIDAGIARPGHAGDRR